MWSFPPLKKIQCFFFFFFATKGDGSCTFSRVYFILVAECDVEERKGGKGWRGGARHARRSEFPMETLPNHLFAPAPIKRIVDGGEAMKGTWAIEKGSRRTGVVMKGNAHDHKCSRAFSVIKDRRRRIQTIVSGAQLRGEVSGLLYLIYSSFFLFTPSCERR